MPLRNAPIRHYAHKFKTEPAKTLLCNSTQVGFTGLQTSYTRPISGGLQLYECHPDRHGITSTCYPLIAITSPLPHYIFPKATFEPRSSSFFQNTIPQQIGGLLNTVVSCGLSIRIRSGGYVTYNVLKSMYIH